MQTDHPQRESPVLRILPGLRERGRLAHLVTSILGEVFGALDAQQHREARWCACVSVPPVRVPPVRVRVRVRVRRASARPIDRRRSEVGFGFEF
jgi:hypothetical protein